jgi:hypothetical protein
MELTDSICLILRRECSTRRRFYGPEGHVAEVTRFAMFDWRQLWEARLMEPLVKPIQVIRQWW